MFNKAFMAEKKKYYDHSRPNERVTAGCGASFNTIKISYYIFFFLTTKQFKSREMITLCFCTVTH